MQHLLLLFLLLVHRPPKKVVGTLSSVFFCFREVPRLLRLLFPRAAAAEAGAYRELNEARLKPRIEASKGSKASKQASVPTDRPTDRPAFDPFSLCLSIHYFTVEAGRHRAWGRQGMHAGGAQPSFSSLFSVFRRSSCSPTLNVVLHSRARSNERSSETTFCTRKRELNAAVNGTSTTKDEEGTMWWVRITTDRPTAVRNEEVSKLFMRASARSLTHSLTLTAKSNMNNDYERIKAKEKFKWRLLMAMCI